MAGLRNGGSLLKFFKKMKVILLWMLVVLLSSCADLKEETQYNGVQSGGEFEISSLLRNKWRLEAYETGPVSKSVLIEFRPQKNLQGNYILSGISAVNFFEAGFHVGKENTIQIAQLSVTEIAGMKAEMEFEEEYFRRLSEIKAYFFRDSRLVLTDLRGHEMIFRPEK